MNNSQLKLNDLPMQEVGALTFTAPGELTDWKAIFNAGGYNTLLNSPPALDEFVQSIAVDVPLGCGGKLEKLVIGNFHFKMNKVNSTQWQLELVP